MEPEGKGHVEPGKIGALISNSKSGGFQRCWWLFVYYFY